MNTYLDQPCERCGSKRKIAKKWKEKIPTFSGGTTVVEYTQIVCTNKVCQKENEEQLQKDAEKREAQRVKKEENKSRRIA
jgi:hypothetical protein